MKALEVFRFHFTLANMSARKTKSSLALDGIKFRLFLGNSNYAFMKFFVRAI